jgi:hypothetical protein
MGIVYKKLTEDDIDLGHGDVDVTMPGGGIATGRKVGLHTFAHTYNVRSFGAVGDGIADDSVAFENAINQARTDQLGVYVPSGIYKIGRELTVSGVDVVGATSGDQSSLVEGAIWPIFKPMAGFSRLFKVGPRTTTDRTNGYTDHAKLENISIDLSGADANFIAIGSDYGCANRVFRNIHIRGLSGSVTAKNFTGIKLYSSSTSTDLNAYNLLEHIQVLHCAHAYDFSSGFAAYWGDNTVINCWAWNALKFYSICGLNNTFINCGIQSLESGWSPDGSTTWGVKAISGTNTQGTEGNTFIGFYIEGVNGANIRPFFHITERTTIINPRGFITTAYHDSGGVQDFIQIVDESGNPQGPLATHGPTMIIGNTVRAGMLNVPNVQQNRIPNGNFLAWPNGISFTTPADGTALAQGFTALKGGSTDYTITRILAPDTMTTTHDQAMRLQVVDNAGGITGIQIDLSDFYTVAGLQQLGAMLADVQKAASARICVGMLVKVTAAQDTLEGAYVSCHSGANSLSTIHTLKYDGTQGLGALKQQAGGWYPVFLNMLVSSPVTQMICKFGLNNDGSHAGTGDFSIQSVFMYPGWYDAYSIWNVLQPRGIDAWAGSNLYAVSDLTAAWTPGAINNGAAATLNVTVGDARLGDQVIVGYDKGLAAGLTISGTVTDNSGNVRVVIANASGGSVTPTAGNATISVLRRSIS